MRYEEIKEFLKPLDKIELRNVINIAEQQLNSSIGIGDHVTLTIEYMIGDANGDTESSCGLRIESQDELDALNIIEDILDNHTGPTKGHWGFMLTRERFKQKPKEVYNILYNQEEAPEEYNGIKLNEKILETISYIVDDCFRGDTEYSFLVYQDYSVKQ